MWSLKMTTEKVASKAIPSKASSTTAPSKTAPQPARRTTATRRSTTTKAPVKRSPRTAAIEKTPAKSQATPTVTVISTTKTKAEKKTKPSKVKMERDSFTMPKDEYAQLAELKARLLALGQPAKKSELLRAGIKLLSAITDARLKTTMAAIPVIKTGRPKKKK